MNRHLLAAGAAMALSAVAAAHEFWIQPNTFRPKVNQPVALRLLVGDGFPGQARPRDLTKLERFVVLGAGVGGSEDQPIRGADGADPAGLFRFTAAGTQVLAYRSRSTPIEMDGAKFNSYLAEEGLEHVLRARESAGTAQSAGRERFSRAAKCVVRVGDGPGAGFDRSAGFPAEITPTSDPYAAKAGDTLSFVVTHDGSPAPGALVRAFCAGHPGKVQSARTDDAGTVSFALDAPGTWLIASVRMTATTTTTAPAEAESGADWDSVWASLTFDLAPAAPVGAAPAP